MAEVLNVMTYKIDMGGVRLDVYLSCEKDMTRSHVKTLLESGHIRVNGNIVKAGYSLKANDKVSVEQCMPIPIAAQAEDIPLDIIYEDEDLAVINKAQGMTVHPAVGNYTGTLVNALLGKLDHLSGINGAIRPGIVHRLDKNTSGLLVVAKNDMAHVSLSKQIAEKTCLRTYRALVIGVVQQAEGIIETDIGRSPKDRKKMAVVPVGKHAVTHYKVIEVLGRYTYMEFVLGTGRTHQIRVHCQYINHPIVGDDIYNKSASPFALKGQLLHAYRLEFTHPRTGERMQFEAALPDYFEQVLATLGYITRGK